MDIQIYIKRKRERKGNRNKEIGVDKREGETKGIIQLPKDCLGIGPGFWFNHSTHSIYMYSTVCYERHRQFIMPDIEKLKLWLISK